MSLRKCAAVVGTALVAVLPAVAGELHVSSACEGLGYTGTYSESSVLINFWSCPLSGGGMRSRVWKANGDIMSEVRQTSTGVVTYWLANIDTDSSPSPIDEAIMYGIVTSPEGEVARHLPQALLDFGISTSTVAFRALIANLLEGYKLDPTQTQSTGGCLDPNNGCLGCCGLGCGGVLGCNNRGQICTPECRAHDDCCRASGCSHCLSLLDDAIKSWTANCPSNCSTPLPTGCNCCGGVGPLCI